MKATRSFRRRLLEQREGYNRIAWRLLERRPGMRAEWRSTIAGFRRGMANLPPEEIALARKVRQLSKDPRNAEEIRRIAYQPLGTMTPAREYAHAICALQFGNLRGDRNPT